MGDRFDNSCVILVLLAFAFCVVSGQPEVETNSGSVRGMTYEVIGVNVSRFVGIPYAIPPVGRLRFRAPVPIDPWADTLNATEFGNICPQDQAAVDWAADIIEHTRIDEDCLTLNVFKPEDTGSAEMAVMVFIHGGGFFEGTTLSYDGSILAASQSIIVVSVNYRLGALGFLSTMDEYAIGNFGLLDQQLAIRWVKDNIGAFGGDPNKITLFGHSAGGMSVGYQVLSPTNNGLFQRAISQSGVPSSLYMVDNPVMWARRLGSALNCSDSTNGEDHRHLISCLRSKTWQEVIDNTPASNPLDLNLRNFVPIVDGTFLPMEPELLIASNMNSTKCEYMFGFTSAEGNMYYYSKPDFAISPGLTQSKFEDFVTYISRPYTNDLNLVKRALLDHYTDWKNISSDFSRLLQLFKIYGDQIFVAPTVAMARKHAKLTGDDYSTYVYQFSYESPSELVPDWLEGAMHGAEIEYLFGAPNALPSLYTPEQREMSDILMKYWANFAKTGNPNTGEAVDAVWSEFTAVDDEYLDLNIPTTMQERPMAADVAFWLNYIPFLSGAACPALPTNCIDVVGQDLGLSLTLSQASILIEAFIACLFVMFVIIAILVGVVCGYHMKVKNRARKDSKDDTVGLTD